MNICQRCGKRFEQDETFPIKSERFCVNCMCRNLFDALEMPTPPSLLDRHTVVPTLLESDWAKKIGFKGREGRKNKRKGVHGMTPSTVAPPVPNFSKPKNER